jgi:GH24 family phage-related lysozyme (muramidase)
VKPSAFAAFWGFTVPLEGCIQHFYADVKGLITVGVGNLVDPIEAALGLTMYRADGVKASRTEIREDWNAVKANPYAARLGHRYAAKLTRLRMRDEDIRVMVEAKLLQNEDVLVKRFPSWDDFPADAQLATHSMSWACGPHFHFPKLEAALLASDFRTASTECQMNEAGNPGLVPRNKANRVLYRNANVVKMGGFNPEQLYWPRDLYAEAEDDTPTPPAMVPARPEREQVFVNPFPFNLDHLSKAGNDDDEPDGAA